MWYKQICFSLQVMWNGHLDFSWRPLQRRTWRLFALRHYWKPIGLSCTTGSSLPYAKKALFKLDQREWIRVMTSDLHHGQRGSDVYLSWYNHTRLGPWLKNGICKVAEFHRSLSPPRLVSFNLSCPFKYLKLFGSANILNMFWKGL